MFLKKLGFISLLLLAAVFTLPLLTGVRKAAGRVTQYGGESVEAMSNTGLPASSQTESAGAQAKSVDESITIRVLKDGKVSEMTLREYVFCALAAEMPGSFEREALRAQAVAIRTFALNRMLAQPFSEHRGADICGDPNHCAAFISREEYIAKGGRYAEQIEEAVSSTDGVGIFFEDGPIQAVFHSSSPGMTESAADVWGSEISYLQSVESPERSGDYLSRVDIDPAEFKEAFLKQHPAAVLSENPSEWFGEEERTAGGLVKSLSVGGVAVSGGEMRVICSLRSANFTVEYRDGALVFSTVGYGHGVGMSQYGAQQMALEGRDYVEILTGYYTGVTVKSFTAEDIFG